jgi:hypothetical protein
MRRQSPVSTKMQAEALAPLPEDAFCIADLEAEQLAASTENVTSVMPMGFDEAADAQKFLNSTFNEEVPRWCETCRETYHRTYPQCPICANPFRHLRDLFFQVADGVAKGRQMTAMEALRHPYGKKTP